MIHEYTSPRTLLQNILWNFLSCFPLSLHWELAPLLVEPVAGPMGPLIISSPYIHGRLQDHLGKKLVMPYVSLLKMSPFVGRGHRRYLPHG